jgi:peptidoglycan/LPS O-acetylase OafA/YrhL
MAAINFIFYFINNQISFSLPYLAFVGYTTFAVLFGILVYEAVMGESKIIRILFNNSILKFFGKISYGLYVYHWPVYILLFPVFLNLLFNKLSLPYLYAKIGSAFLVILFAVLISLFSYHFFEKKFLRLKKRYE